MKKYDEVLMKTAFLWGSLSSCKRKQVGAIISRNFRIISNGYNGTISRADNCCEVDCDVCSGSGHNPNYKPGTSRESCIRCNGKGLISKNTVVHAEANAILSAAKVGISLEGCRVDVTLSPCVECSKLIIQSGIKEVYYAESYKGDEGAKFLKENGILVKHQPLNP